MQEKIEAAINDKIDVPGVDEQDEAYLIHLLVGLAAAILFIFIKTIGSR